MRPHYHTFLGAIYATILFLIFPQIGVIGFLLIFFSSFLIDFDHYATYVLKKKDFSLANAYKWHLQVGEKLLSLPRKKRNKVYIHLCPLHGIEIIIILSILSIFVSKYFLFIITGMLFHLVLDLFHQLKCYWDRADKMCIIHDYFKFKKLKNIEDI